ncbi:uncharacterized protein LOC143205911 [Rhynchophorus ferrugineus]|uniref:uncharacterized protein LOC143205911 n=1 Tax=Rhynchophorus ferrugineus TaxID=354439 RepID=UPI003FCC9E87
MDGLRAPFIQHVGGIPEEIGIKVDIWPLTVLAFADDLIMMAYSRVGLQTQLDRIRDYLQSVGLSVNALKSQTIAIKALGHQKKIVVDPSGSFKLLGYAIPALKRRPEQQRPINSPREAGEINSPTFEATTMALDPANVLISPFYHLITPKPETIYVALLELGYDCRRTALMHISTLKSPMVAWEFPLRYQTPLLRVGKLKRLKSSPFIYGEAALGNSNKRDLRA